MSFVDSLFQAVKGVIVPTPLKYSRLGKWSQNKVRLIKMFFKDLEENKVFFLPIKVKKVGGELKRVHLGHDVGVRERSPKYALISLTQQNAQKKLKNGLIETTLI